MRLWVTKPDIFGIHDQRPKVSIIASNNVAVHMARILDLFLDRNSNRACRKYPDNQSLYEALGREETEAIRCLSARISGMIFNIGKSHRLEESDVEELICDCIMICLQKIRNGKYVFQGHSPATFAVEIAKNRARNYSRKVARHEHADLEDSGEQSEELEYGSLEETELLEQLLHKLDPSCQNLIRLKYLEQRRDKEVIEEHLTQYTTVDALKNHRSKCMKKLVEIGAAISSQNTAEQ